MTYEKKINKAVKKASGLNTQTSELGQLSKLLSNDVINTIFEENNKHRNQHNSLIFSSIHIAWIDKIPSAKFTNNTKDHFGNDITQRVELGDALIIDIHACLDKSKVKSTAFILQAKRAKSSTLPVVPVYTGKTKNNSSLKELALLQNWPTFDLYTTARTKNTALSALKLPSLASAPLAYGGFAVCPPSLNKNTWKAHWMCAQPQYGAQFDITFGELLASFFKIGKPSHQVGQAFKLQNYGDEWSKLINKILEISTKYSTPKAYEKIYGSSRIKNTPMRFSQLLHLTDLRIPLNKYPQLLIDRFFDGFDRNITINDDLHQNIPKGKMPIIIYNSISTEDSELVNSQRD